jgi:hypothetical protein
MVQLIDIEWIDGQLPTFLNIVTKTESNFDNEFVKNLISEMDFWYPIFYFIYLPFMFYFCLVMYYFCYVITDPF